MPESHRSYLHHASALGLGDASRLAHLCSKKGSAMKGCPVFSATLVGNVGRRPAHASGGTGHIPPPVADLTTIRVRRRKILHGMISEYSHVDPARPAVAR